RRRGGDEPSHRRGPRPRRRGLRRRPAGLTPPGRVCRPRGEVAQTGRPEPRPRRPAVSYGGEMATLSREGQGSETARPRVLAAGRADVVARRRGPGSCSNVRATLIWVAGGAVEIGRAHV